MNVYINIVIVSLVPIYIFPSVHIPNMVDNPGDGEARPLSEVGGQRRRLGFETENGCNKRMTNG